LLIANPQTKVLYQFPPLTRKPRERKLKCGFSVSIHEGGALNLTPALPEPQIRLPSTLSRTFPIETVQPASLENAQFDQMDCCYEAFVNSAEMICGVALRV
jgi:hypothetical protein